MNKVKRFTDFFAGFAAFSAFMYVFCEYMEYDFREIESLTDKLKYFLSTEPRLDYFNYVPLIVLFTFACAFSVLLNKYPQLTLAAASLPLIYSVALFTQEKIYERPMLYILPALIQMSGCLYECIRKDREDRGRRAAFAVDLLGLTVSVFSLYVIYIANRSEKLEAFENSLLFFTVGALLFGLSLIKRLPNIISSEPFFPSIEGISGLDSFVKSPGRSLSLLKDHISSMGETLIKEIPFIQNGFMEQQITALMKTETPDLKAFKMAAVIFTVLAVIRLIHRDIYYIDAFLSLFPPIIFIYMWNANKIPVLGEILAFMSVIYFIARVAVMIFCKPRFNAFSFKKNKVSKETRT